MQLSLHVCSWGAFWLGTHNYLPLYLRFCNLGVRFFVGHTEGHTSLVTCLQKDFAFMNYITFPSPGVSLNIASLGVAVKISCRLFAAPFFFFLFYRLDIRAHKRRLGMNFVNDAVL